MRRLMERVEADVVYGQRREQQGESAMLRRGTAALFYRLLRRLADGDMPVDSGDFRLMSRKVLVAFSIPCRSSSRFTWPRSSRPGALDRAAPRVALAYDRAPRKNRHQQFWLARQNVRARLRRI